jgi:hypothetical protein
MPIRPALYLSEMLELLYTAVPRTVVVELPRVFAIRCITKAALSSLRGSSRISLQGRSGNALTLTSTSSQLPLLALITTRSSSNGGIDGILPFPSECTSLEETVMPQLLVYSEIKALYMV